MKRNKCKTQLARYVVYESYYVYRKVMRNQVLDTNNVLPPFVLLKSLQGIINKVEV